MSETEGKKRSGCKVVGCGCLVLLALIGAISAIVVYLGLQKSAPGDIQAHHFVPESSLGSATLNLHTSDEGLGKLFALVLAQTMEQDQDAMPPMLKKFLPSLSSGDLQAGPFGPQIIISVPPPQADEDPSPLVIVDLNSYSRAAATAIQIALKTTLASSSTESSYLDVSVFEHSTGAYTLAVHKGFLLAAKDLDAVKVGIDTLQQSSEAAWPEGPSLPDTCDMHAQWTGDFSELAKMGSRSLHIAPPKDGDFESPVSDVAYADLCVDVVSSDMLKVTVRGDAVNLEAVQRVEADLIEHAGELATELEKKQLTFTFTTRTDALSAILEGEVTGLEQVIKSSMQPAPAPTEEP